MKTSFNLVQFFLMSIAFFLFLFSSFYSLGNVFPRSLKSTQLYLSADNNYLKFGNLKEAIPIFLQAYDMVLIDNPNSFEQGAILMKIGACHAEISNFDSAFYYYKKVEKELPVYHFNNGSDSLLLLCNYLFYKTELLKSLGTYRECEKEFPNIINIRQRRFTDLIYVSDVYRVWAELYAETRHFDEANKKLNEAFSIRKLRIAEAEKEVHKANDSFLLKAKENLAEVRADYGVLFLTRAKISIEEDDWVKALKEVQEGLSYFKGRLENQDYFVKSHLLIAHVFSKNGKIQEALTYLANAEKRIQLNKPVGSEFNYERALGLHIKGIIAVQKADFNEARVLFSESNRILLNSSKQAYASNIVLSNFIEMFKLPQIKENPEQFREYFDDARYKFEDFLKRCQSEGADPIITGALLKNLDLYNSFISQYKYSIDVQNGKLILKQNWLIGAIVSAILLIAGVLRTKKNLDSFISKVKTEVSNLLLDSDETKETALNKLYHMIPGGIRASISMPLKIIINIKVTLSKLININLLSHNKRGDKAEGNINKIKGDGNTIS